MPYRSKAQHRLFRAKESRGELPSGTASRWANHTPGGVKKLPDKVRRKKGKKGSGRLLKAAEDLFKPANAFAIDQQKKVLGAQQMQAIQQPKMAPVGSTPLTPAPPGIKSQPTGGLGTGGYGGAASALGPPVLGGKLGNGPGAGFSFGNQTGGQKVGMLLAAESLFAKTALGPGQTWTLDDHLKQIRDRQGQAAADAYTLDRRAANTLDTTERRRLQGEYKQQYGDTRPWKEEAPDVGNNPAMSLASNDLSKIRMLSHLLGIAGSSVGTGMFGAGVGGLIGSGLGIARGNISEGVGRGVIRGGATGAGAGAGSYLGNLAGNAIGGAVGQPGKGTLVGGLLGLGLGGAGGYLGSGALLGPPDKKREKQGASGFGQDLLRGPMMAAGASLFSKQSAAPLPKPPAFPQPPELSAPPSLATPPAPSRPAPPPQALQPLAASPPAPSKQSFSRTLARGQQPSLAPGVMGVGVSPDSDWSAASLNGVAFGDLMHASPGASAPPPAPAAPAAPAALPPDLAAKPAPGRLSPQISKAQAELQQMQASGAKPYAIANKQRYIKQLGQMQGNTAESYAAQGHSPEAINRWQAVEKPMHEQGAQAAAAGLPPPAPPPQTAATPPLAIARATPRPKPGGGMPGSVVNANAPGVPTTYSSVAQQKQLDYDALQPAFGGLYNKQAPMPGISQPTAVPKPFGARGARPGGPAVDPRAPVSLRPEDEQALADYRSLGAQADSYQQQADELRASRLAQGLPVADRSKFPGQPEFGGPPQSEAMPSMTSAGRDLFSSPSTMAGQARSPALEQLHRTYAPADLSQTVPKGNIFNSGQVAGGQIDWKPSGSPLDPYGGAAAAGLPDAETLDKGLTATGPRAF